MHNPDIPRPGQYHPNSPLPSADVFVLAEPLLFEHAAELVTAAAEGIQDVTALMGLTMHVRVIPPAWGDGPYKSVDWFVQRSVISDPSGQHNGQLLWNTLHRDLAADPARETTPHSGYMLVAHDITALNADQTLLNFVFGATDKGISQSVQSIHRFMEADLSDEELVAVTRHVARHEFGHLVGLDDSSIRNQDTRGGIYKGHCANDCTMQQVMSVSEAVGLAKRLQHRPHAGFCADCTTYVRSI